MNDSAPNVPTPKFLPGTIVNYLTSAGSRQRVRILVAGIEQHTSSPGEYQCIYFCEWSSLWDNGIHRAFLGEIVLEAIEVDDE